MQADFAYSELRTALEGVTEAQAWSVLPEGGMDYLHSDGSIQGIVLHIASGKYMYASSAFLGGSIRWRNLAEQVEAFEPSWEAAVEFLEKGHKVWMDSWAHLTDDQLTMDVEHIRGRILPAHRIITILTHHDGWHGGQIAMLRAALGETDVPPPSAAEDIRMHCAELPHW